ncbi:hypothetical protein [Chryseobacterium chendengshani]|uniref:hypothetical protein n=1 Tax=Chryseobacterium sp. LJ756 TaxID=2864113 RepID=UPI001C63C2AF|nr:hypothetical protein [Chryseobacterium sp. LJ756]MBW7676772.1 hypothetical protein [Chryseobacterium sp. LJ756]
MDTINVKVAFCTQCKGYYAATSVRKEDNNHPEIIDHYFYHGEPHFTLNSRLFDENTQYLNTDIRIIKLSEHQVSDHQHCCCLKEIKTLKTVTKKTTQKDSKTEINPEKYEIESDVYFKDLYYTYDNFHGFTRPVSRSISA